MRMPRLPELRLPRVAGWLVALPAALALVLLAWPRQGPLLRQLQIVGSFRHVTPDEVRAAALPYLDAGFFSADIDAVREAVAKTPWVARARVEREWPGTLVVHIWEREPFARWNNDALIDVGAVVFTPKAADLAVPLPRLGGTSGHEQEVVEAWRRLSAALAHTPFALSGLALDARGEWTAHTASSGIELRLGQQAPDDKLPMLQGAVVRALRDRLGEVNYVDMRYGNGFAVGWRNTPGGQDG